MRLVIVMGVLAGAILACALILHADLARVAAGLAVGAAAGFGISRLAARRPR